MKRKYLLLLILFFGISIYAEDTKQLNYSTNNPVNRFTFNLFSSMTSDLEKQHSLVVSPLSASFVLGMLNDGACGKTKEELNNLLGCDVETFDSLASAILQKVTLKKHFPISERDSTNIRISNCMLLNTQCRLKDSYREKVVNNYSAWVKNMDFKSPEVKNEINEWCREKTDGNLSTAIDYIDPQAYVYLLNTIFLHANWKYEFDQKNTKMEKFKKLDGRSEKMKIMHAFRPYEYYKNKIYSAFSMDYCNENFQMIILLPNKRKRINDILKDMDEHQWNVVSDGMSERWLDVRLPIFTIETVAVLDSEFIKLGLSSPFSLERADFRNMSPDLLCISYVIQKTNIVVNEQGTKALSATGVNFLTACKGRHSKKPKYIKFYATHPFIFAIKDKGTNTILFIGEFDGK